MQQRMQQTLLSNPDALRQVMDNPVVQQLMNDPNNVRQLLLSNPQMQDIIEVGIDFYFEYFKILCLTVRFFVASSGNKSHVK